MFFDYCLSFTTLTVAARSHMGRLTPYGATPCITDISGSQRRCASLLVNKDEVEVAALLKVYFSSTVVSEHDEAVARHVTNLPEAVLGEKQFVSLQRAYPGVGMEQQQSPFRDDTLKEKASASASAFQIGLMASVHLSSAEDSDRMVCPGCVNYWRWLRYRL